MYVNDTLGSFMNHFNNIIRFLKKTEFQCIRITDKVRIYYKATILCKNNKIYEVENVCRFYMYSVTVHITYIAQ